LRRRLLVNATVDPDEAAKRLPPGLRPHVTPAGTVVGCCLLEIEHLRPALLPASWGVGQRAAAHRISAEWVSDAGELVVGVYVPERRTDSRLALALGGRCFPGLHRPASVELCPTAMGLRWSVRGRDEFCIDVTVTIPDDSSVDLSGDRIAGTCIGANVGMSTSHRGALEAARMEPVHRAAREVAVDVLESSFIAGFSSAEPAPGYLMEDVAVSWTRDVAHQATKRAAA
jgi:hypothetical protein